MVAVEELVASLIPYAPDLGLYTAPRIPARKLQRALKEFASEVSPREVLALYDATRMGTGGDGIVFTREALYYQNHNLQQPQRIPYRDIVGAEVVHSFLKGTRLRVLVNPGRATVAHELDFSAHPKAATYVKQFLDEIAMLQEIPERAEETDWEAVREALQSLREQGRLSSEDFERILQLAHTAKKNGRL